MHAVAELKLMLGEKFFPLAFDDVIVTRYFGVVNAILFSTWKQYIFLKMFLERIAGRNY